MKKASLIAILGTLTVLTGGCSNIPFLGGNEPEATAPASPEPTSSPQAKPKEETAPQDAKAKTEKPKSIPTTSLVQSTSSTERVRQVQKGRTDPFDNISIEPVVKVSPIQGRGNSPVPRVDSIPRVNRPGGTRVPNKINITPPKTTPGRKTNSGSSSNPTNRTTTPKPSITVREPSRINPSPRPVPELPPPPQPTIARAIEVTGVVQAGGVPQAIVKEPNSDFQRYVKAGDYLANGQVLVKRIEMKSGPQPVVVLEQLGVEVSRRVGDKPITAQGDSANPSG